jgi:Zn-dependent peptidase ImmA (M78 family)
MLTAAGERPDVDALVVYRSSSRGPAEAAASVRKMFGLSDGPVPDAIGLAERIGTVVVVRNLGTPGQDAVSSWSGGVDVPLVLIGTGLPVDRQRFTVLHELGHLLLHTVPDEAQEQEAQQFAAQLLIPRAAAARELAGLSVSDRRRLVRLRETWGCQSLP